MTLCVVLRVLVSVELTVCSGVLWAVCIFQPCLGCFRFVSGVVPFVMVCWGGVVALSAPLRPP